MAGLGGKPEVPDRLEDGLVFDPEDRLQPRQFALVDSTGPHGRELPLFFATKVLMLVGLATASERIVEGHSCVLLC